jgi:phosphoglycerate dehydrogenase-like enzyme
MEQTHSTNQPIATFFGDRGVIQAVYAQGRREAVAGMTNLCPDIIDLDSFDRFADFLRTVEIIFSTWGMPLLTPARLDQLPALKAVFYAAGTVRGFAGPLLERGITVVSAWQANAVPVAEFTQAQILLAAKGYFRNTRAFRAPAAFQTAFRGRGNFGEKIALLGAGAIGRKLIDLLRPFNLRLLVFDPFLPPDEAAELDVRKVSLEEAFAEAYVVSNHLADLPETRNMLHRALFERMRRDATFINTGRGWTVDEEAMLEVLALRPDLTALIDVTQVEPPREGSLFYSLPNVHLSTHIAGSIEDERVRLADYCIQDFRAWRRGEPLRYRVSMEMMKTMA